MSIWLIKELGLAVYSDPANMETKFVHLALRERKERPASRLKLFECVDITVYDRAALPMLLGGDVATATELREEYREKHQQAKARGKAGVALLVISVAPIDGKPNRAALFRTMPVVLMKEELSEEAYPEWKDMMKDIINNGTSIKQMIAEREKAGLL